MLGTSKTRELHAWPVGTLKPNRFGLFDVLGNVSEWCMDTYGPYPNGAAEVIDDPRLQEGQSATERVNRGGHFESPAKYLRSAIRDHDAPHKFNATMGLRLARTIPN